jgi:hypothetical protein
VDREVHAVRYTNARIALIMQSRFEDSGGRRGF